MLGLLDFTKSALVTKGKKKKRRERERERWAGVKTKKEGERRCKPIIADVKKAPPQKGTAQKRN